MKGKECRDRDRDPSGLTYCTGSEIGVGIAGLGLTMMMMMMTHELLVIFRFGVIFANDCE